MNTPFLVIVAGGIGVAGGVAIGYKIAERNLIVQFEERLLEETDKTRSYYEQTVKKFTTPQEAANALIPPGTVLAEKSHVEKNADDVEAQRLERTAYHTIVKSNYTAPDEKEEQPTEQEPLFPPNDDDVTRENLFDGGPRIITQGEYMQNDSGFDQTTLTFYTVDQVLVDERDEVIQDKIGTVGAGGTLLFGTDSSDPNTVHVQNPRLQREFEVVRHSGSYSQEVLGYPHEDTSQRPSGRGR
jgi:hypothetical protein